MGWLKRNRDETLRRREGSDALADESGSLLHGARHAPGGRDKSLGGSHEPLEEVERPPLPRDALILHAMTEGGAVSLIKTYARCRGCEMLWRPKMLSEGRWEIAVSNPFPKKS